MDSERREEKQTRRDNILNTVSDVAADMMYYDRKEDDELPRGAIEEAVSAGEITKAEIVQAFSDGLGL